MARRKPSPGTASNGFSGGAYGNDDSRAACDALTTHSATNAATLTPLSLSERIFATSARSDDDRVLGSWR